MSGHLDGHVCAGGQGEGADCVKARIIGGAVGAAARALHRLRAQRDWPPSKSAVVSPCSDTLGPPPCTVGVDRGGSVGCDRFGRYRRMQQLVCGQRRGTGRRPAASRFRRRTPRTGAPPAFGLPLAGLAAALPSRLFAGTGLGGGTGFLGATAAGPKPVIVTASADGAAWGPPVRRECRPPWPLSAPSRPHHRRAAPRLTLRRNERQHVRAADLRGLLADHREEHTSGSPTGSA
jgi:hypothetical protein